MDRPLAGVTVLDFSRLLPGPYCTFLLGRLGAEIIKVEDTVTGDLLRYLPPFVEGAGVTFGALNGNKQSVAIDLKSPAGQAIARDLAVRSDVVVEGFRPGVAARLGIDFATLSSCNPRIVYCSLSGFGQEGPLRDLSGHDLTYAGITGLIDALSLGEPRVPGVQLVDAAGALLAAVRILAALHAREAGPHYLDVSLIEGAQALMPVALAEAQAGPLNGVSLGEMLRGSARNNLYPCADGRWLALSPIEEPFWQRLCSLLRDEGLVAAGQSVTAETLQEVFRQRTCVQWYDLLSAADIPCAPVNTVREAIDQPPWTEEIGEGGMDLFTAERSARDRVPKLGEHTAHWLATLGYSAERIAELRADAVIGTVDSG